VDGNHKTGCAISEREFDVGVVLGKNGGEVKGKSESALFRHLGEEFSDEKNKSRTFLREHLKTLRNKLLFVLF
jgi:hypothetical protein